ALATEAPSQELLDQAPHGRHAPLITRPMWTHILVMGAYMVAVLMVVLWTELIVGYGVDPIVRNTLVFNIFVFMQIFNEINARSTRFDRGVFVGLTQSSLFIAVLVVTVIAQVGIVQFGGELFRTTPLGLEHWLVSTGIGATVLVVGAAIRFAGRQLSSSESHRPQPALRPVR
ncbi:MAG: cation transporting ATPase C-terminal domain-containing protein, partial [Myxococcota bacterium]